MNDVLFPPDKTTIHREQQYPGLNDSFWSNTIHLQLYHLICLFFPLSTSSAKYRVVNGVRLSITVDKLIQLCDTVGFDTTTRLNI